MNRRHLLIYIDEYLAGTLNPGDRELIERYLDENPDERKYVEDESRLKGLLQEIETPDPGEAYWTDLDRRIERESERETLSRAITEPRREPVNLGAIARYVAPLAAALILFLGSVTYTELPTYTNIQTAAIDDSGDSRSDRNIDYYAQYSLEYGMIGSTVLGPPGSFGRKMLIMGVFSGSN